MIEKGILPTPEYTVRVVFGFELYGFAAIFTEKRLLYVNSIPVPSRADSKLRKKGLEQGPYTVWSLGSFTI